MHDIIADETVILFQSSAPQNRKRTRITFDLGQAGNQVGGDEAQAAIWWRRNTEAWHMFPLEKTGPAPQYKGSFYSESVGPGDVLQYRMYDAKVYRDYVPDTVPNETQKGSGIEVRHVEIFGLLNMSRNTPDKMKNSYRSDAVVGGTYYGRKIATPGIRTNVLIEVSQQEPVYGLPHYLRFEKPEVSVLALGEEQYDLNLMPLTPGANYYCLIRYSDSAGNWFFEDAKFTTLRRQVTLKADTIHIDNDGDPHADGEASFNFQFGQGATNTAIFFMGHADFKVHSGQTIALGTMLKLDTSLPLVDQVWPLPTGPAEKTFGPFSVTPETPDITVYAAGTEYDGIFESDERAASGDHHYLSYPYGPGETVIDKAASITANPLDGDDFTFTVNYRYSVVYL
nr:hypothetical protein [uncultured Dongia sp.]